MSAALGAILTIVLVGCGNAPIPASPVPVAVTSDVPGPASLGPAASGDPAPNDGWISVVAERFGVTLTLSASAGRAVAGELIRVRVDVLNAGLDVVSWPSGCGLRDRFGIDGPSVTQPPNGRVWPGVAGVVKGSATSGPVFHDRGRAPTDPDGLVSNGCPLVLSYEDIDPGNAIATEILWAGLTSDGVPAPPGAYRLTFEAPFSGRGPGGEFSIGAALEIPLEGPVFGGIPSTLAIDAALADPRVSAWIDQKLPIERLQGAEIRLVDGRWRFRIRVAGERSTVVFVDPATGRVEDVRLAD